MSQPRNYSLRSKGPLLSTATFTDTTTMPSISMEKFKGSEIENAVAWVQLFRKWAAFNELSEEKAASAFPFYLGGAASYWYESLPSSITSNLNALLDKFQERFCKRLFDINIYSQQQQPHESANEFISRVQMMANQHEIPEKILVGVIINGLKTSIRSSVLQKEPTDINTARRAAVLAEMAGGVNTTVTENTIASLTESINELKQQLAQKETAFVIDKDKRPNSSYQMTNEPKNRPHGNPQYRRWEGDLVWSVLLMVMLCVTTQCYEDVKQRINYGVVFSYKDKIHLAEEYWRHTFQFELPKKVEFTPIKSCHHEDAPCYATRQIIHNINTMRARLTSTLEETNRQALKLIPEMKLNKTKAKRSIFSFIGDISKSLFGTATEDDLKVLRHHIATLSLNSAKLTKALTSQTKDLSSFMLSVDHRFQNVLRSLQQHNNDLYKLAKNMSTTLTNFHVIFTEMSSMVLDQTTNATILLTKLEELRLGIYELSKHKLSPLILPVDILEIGIKHIQDSLVKKNTQFHLVHSHPYYYYRNAKFIAVRSDNYIYITIKFPISVYKEPSKLYKVSTIPVPINHTSSHGTQLLDLPDYFILSHTGESTSISHSDLMHCENLNGFHCKFHSTFVKNSVTTCINALFYDNSTRIKQYCHFTFISNVITPSIQEISPSLVIVYKTPSLSLQCIREQKLISGCPFCIIKVPCMCSMSSGKQYIPVRSTGCVPSSDDIETYHPINLALLREFFEPGKFQNVFGSTLFSTVANISIPPFDIFQHSFQDIVANDHKEHLSLTKMINRTKNREKIFRSLAEPLLSGQITLPSDWPNINFYFAVSALVIATLSVVAFIYTLYKLKAISGMVLLLSTRTNALEAPDFIYTDLKDTAPLTTIPPYIQELLSNESMHFHIITYGLLFIVIITLYHIVKRHFVQRSTVIVIEFSSGVSCVQVEIAKLKLCPLNYQFNKPSNITNVDVKGTFRPKLVIDIVDFQCVSKLTDETMSLKKEFVLSFMSAWKLKKILQQPYFAHIFLRHAGYSQLINETESASVQVNLYPTLS